MRAHNKIGRSVGRPRSLRSFVRLRSMPLAAAAAVVIDASLECEFEHRQSARRFWETRGRRDWAGG